MKNVKRISDINYRNKKRVGGVSKEWNNTITFIKKEWYLYQVEGYEGLYTETGVNLNQLETPHGEVRVDLLTEFQGENQPDLPSFVCLYY